MMYILSDRVIVQASDAIIRNLARALIHLPAAFFWASAERGVLCFLRLKSPAGSALDRHFIKAGCFTLAAGSDSSYLLP